MKKIIEIYTDGACISNPNGKGGWAYVYADRTKEKASSVSSATNNQMEILAIKAAIASTPEGSTVKIYTDSQYAINVITGKFNRYANRELLSKVDDEMRKRDVKFEWVKAHSGNQLNEYCDRLAHQAAMGAKNHDG